MHADVGEDWLCPHCEQPIGQFWPKPIAAPPFLHKLAEHASGIITECAALPDGSGFATMTLPLPPGHWLTAPGDNVPPMPFKIGTVGDAVIGHITREQFADAIRAAGKYAVRCATMNGREIDFDPDAMLQNFVVGMLGYWTLDGLSADPTGNP